MATDEKLLPSDHIPVKKPRKGCKNSQVDATKQSNKVDKLIQKISNLKYASRLITCELDDQLLTSSTGLFSSLTTRLDALHSPIIVRELENLIFSATNNGTNNDGIVQQPSLPPPIRPMLVNTNGVAGSVPLARSITWSRCRPRSMPTCIGDESTAKFYFEQCQEPEVLLIIEKNEIKQLQKRKLAKSQELFLLTQLGKSIQQLNRPVTCVLITASASRQSTGSRKSESSPSTAPLSLIELSLELQINWGVRSVRFCPNLNDAGLIIASYCQAIAQRPFKQDRLDRDNGLPFLPDTIKMGLGGCASRGRGPGQLPSADAPSDHARAWANRLWLSQLGQWKGMTGEVANAVCQIYPTARTLFNQIADDDDGGSEVATESSTNKFTAQLAQLEVRRGAGALLTRRRLGPELARRIVRLFTSTDPNEIID